MLSLKKIALTISIVVLSHSFVINSAKSSTIYSAGDDFSGTANQNGVWSYTDGSTLLSSSVSVGGVSTWNNTGSLWGQQVSGNTTKVDQELLNWFTLSPNELRLDPEGQTVSATFTAPSSGVYSITGDFAGDFLGEGVNVGIAILDNGSTVFSNSLLKSLIISFNLSETLNAGDTIAFEVLGAGGFGGQSTALRAYVTATGSSTAVPEPTTLAFLAVGLAGLGGRRHYRKA